jgi:transcriptional regulator with XRE-family HTH domain
VIRKRLLYTAVLTLALFAAGCPFAMRAAAGVWQLTITPWESGEVLPVPGNNPILELAENLRFTMTGDSGTVEGSWAVKGRNIRLDSDPIISEGTATLQAVLERDGGSLSGTLAWFPNTGAIDAFDVTGVKLTEQEEPAAEGEGADEGGAGS